MTKESVSVLAGASTLPTHGGSEAEVISAAASGAEGYIVLASTALEPKRLLSTPTRMRHLLNCYSKKVLQIVNNPVKMKHKKQCLLSEEPVKTENIDKKVISVKPWRSRRKQRR
jgi:hypothetical protein